MQWLTDRELDELDAFLRGETPGTGTTVLPMLETIEGIVALCRAYPRASHELRSLRQETMRLRLHVAQESERCRKLETELRLAEGKIAGLERHARAVA